ncbi:MAG: type II toxin-antitoxin system CcdA family antitoxin [Pseudomonadota bacterium]
MHALYNPGAPKKPANLSVNSDLLKKARDLDINLSSILEQALEEEVKRRLRERWLRENQTAIAEYNTRVDAGGVFSDGVRGF